MPAKKPKKKRAWYKGAQDTGHELELLNSRALLALDNYLYREGGDEAHKSMERLFKDYKTHKKKVHVALIRAFKYLITDRFIPNPDDPPYYKLPTGPPPSKEVIKEAKKQINRIAKKVWKKK